MSAKVKVKAVTHLRCNCTGAGRLATSWQCAAQSPASLSHPLAAEGGKHHL